MNEKKDSGKTRDVFAFIKNCGKRRTGVSSKRGIYTAAVSALAIVIVIIFNLAVGGLKPGMLEYDITGKDLYTVTDQSADFLKTLDKDVDVVVLAQNDTIDKQLLKFINNYAKISPRIKLKFVDPVLDPTALTTYNAQENNIVVSCAETNKTRLLNLAGIDGYQDGLILYDAQTYYYSNQLKPVALDAEGQLTSAVNYVTSETVNKMYLLKGHGETDLGINASSSISKANIQTAELNLLKDGGVPEDCQMILCCNPEKDLTDDELTMLETYLQDGGKAMLLLDASALKNFNALLAEYGLQMQSGYIQDTERYYKEYARQYGYYCIYPVQSKESDITKPITTDALLRGSRGMLQITAGRGDSVLTPFLTTSEKGVLVVDQNHSTQGEYILGASAIETIAGKVNAQSRLTVISAIDLISDDIPTSLSNMEVFINAVTMNFGQAQNLVIPSKSLDVQLITISHPVFWSVLFIGVIPVALLAGGLVYWTKRRNR